MGFNLDEDVNETLRDVQMKQQQNIRYTECLDFDVSILLLEIKYLNYIFRYL